jgi:hypothetical protein
MLVPVVAAARDDVFGSLATFCEDHKLLLEGDHKFKFVIWAITKSQNFVIL